MRSQLSFIPTPFEGEHILSTMARWGKLQGERDTKRVLNRLSDNIRAFTPTNSYEPMFDDFIKHYGDCAERNKLLEQHTSLKYHSALIQYKKIYPVENRKVYYPGGVKPKFPKKVSRLSALTTPQQSKLAFSGAWRWCQSCSKLDNLRRGTSFWHVAHQLPSAITCYQHHHQILSEGCHDCGFSYTDIRNHSAPPVDDKCPICSAKIAPKTYALNEHTQWLLENSMRLLEQQGTLSSPQYSHQMKNGVAGFFAKASRISRKAPIYLADSLQNEFKDWLFSNGLSVFFKQPELAVDERVLSIDAGRYQARNWPPISVLLWLRFFGVESISNRRI